MQSVKVLNEHTQKHMNCLNGSDKDCIKCLLYKACHGEGNYADRMNKAAEWLE